MSTSYGINSSIIAVLTQPSINATYFKDITVEGEYWDWLSALVNKLYDPQYYPGYPVPANKRFALSIGNRVVSPLRLTQRRIKLAIVTDKFASGYVDQGWVSTSIGYFGTNEERSGAVANVSYTVDGSHRGLGGYVVNLDLGL